MANAFIFVIAIALIGLGLFVTVISLLWVLEGVFSMELAIELLKYMVIGIVIVLMASVVVLLSDSGSQDMYTLKKRKIEIIISKKVSAYDKRKGKYVL
jgi:hypothetical protein